MATDSIDSDQGCPPLFMGDFCRSHRDLMLAGRTQRIILDLNSELVLQIPIAPPLNSKFALETAIVVFPNAKLVSQNSIVPLLNSELSLWNSIAPHPNSKLSLQNSKLQ
ncbi:MAG: hypothetical protein HC769_00065 [Cyanobacteria bacterium CRU_2_1]|nr:hypothetical protein [Cyanobacteria bacterium RU_5_0]NJR57377.1 hypothetical protein [Cyanobacteria bacterium CRU_2_1]